MPDSSCDLKSLDALKEVEWMQARKRRPFENTLKNLAVSAALVLCAVALRSGAVPALTESADIILSAATDQSILDDHLGKLSIVSSLFPEATLVFGELNPSDLVLPVSGGQTLHVWNAEEPYMAFASSWPEVYCSSDGVVMGVYHGNDEELLVEIRCSDTLSCIYGNLCSTTVQAGDAIRSGDCVGQMRPGECCTFEVKVNGVSVNPAEYLASVL